MSLNRSSFLEGCGTLLSQAAPLALALAFSLAPNSHVEISCAQICLAYLLGMLIAGEQGGILPADKMRGRQHFSGLPPFSSWLLLAVPALMTAVRASWPVVSFLAEYLCLNLAWRLPQNTWANPRHPDSAQFRLAIETAAILLHAGALLSCLCMREYPKAGTSALCAAVAMPACLYLCLRYLAVLNRDLAKTTEGDSQVYSNINPDIPGIKSLTARELSVVELTAQGLTSKECAEKLGLKPSTVREYLRRAYGKLGIVGSQELKDLLAPKESAAREAAANHGDAILERVSFAIVPLSLSFLVAPLGIAPERWGAGATDVLAIASGALACLTLMAARQAGRDDPKIPISKGPIVAAIAVFCALLLVTSLLADSQTPLFLPFRIAARFELAALLTAYIIDSCKDDASADGALGSRLPLYFFVLGLALEEIWRASHWFSFMPATFFFIIPSLVVAFRTLQKRPSKQAIACLALLATGFASCLFASKNLAKAPIFLSLFLLLAPFIALAKTSLFRPQNARSILTFSLGLYAGVYGMNAYASIFTYHVEALGTFGTQTGVEVLSIAVATVVFLGAGVYLLRDVETDLARRSPRDSDLASSAEVAQYLAAFNLTRTQVDVATLLLQGKTVEEIATALCYSPITVRAARNRVIEVLGVDATSDLTEYISAGIRRSQAD